MDIAVIAIAIWVVTAAMYLNLTRYLRSLQRRRKQEEAAVQCTHALGAGCSCTGCPGGYCPNGAAHCTCFYCVTCCFGPLAHGGSGSTMHFTGGGGGIVSGSSGAGGGAGGSYSWSPVPAPPQPSPGPPGGPLPRRMPRSGRAGIAGFDERGAADFSLAPGRVLGLRQWSVAPPDLSGSPLDTSWNPQYITGATGKQWTNRVFEAECTYNKNHRPPVDVDEQGIECGCGCWAYFSPGGMNDWTKPGAVALTGIIEGTGRVLIGELGFRCQRARIVALTLTSVIRPVVQGPREQVTEAELAAAQSSADAWMAVIEDRLGSLFPDVQMFATVKGMLATFPLGEKFE